MLRKPRFIIFLIVLSMATVWVVMPVFALRITTSESRHFDTGFTVSGAFLEFYDNHGGLFIFGYPISGTFTENGVIVQYFQKARLEYYLDSNGQYEVRLGKLGEDVNPQRTPPRKFVWRPRTVYFPQTGYSVSYYFLDFFRAYGGVDFFGYPITAVESTPDGKLVQYFQHFKLVYDVYHTSDGVQVGNLGEIYISANRDSLPSIALVSSLSATIDEVKSLRVAVSVAYPQFDTSVNQEVYISVMRDDATPAESARVTMWFSDTDGAEIPGSRQLVVLDSDGRAKCSVPLVGGDQGEYILVHVQAEYAGIIELNESGLFKIWRTD